LVPPGQLVPALPRSVIAVAISRQTSLLLSFPSLLFLCLQGYPVVSSLRLRSTAFFQKRQNLFFPGFFLYAHPPPFDGRLHHSNNFFLPHFPFPLQEQASKSLVPFVRGSLCRGIAVPSLLLSDPVQKGHAFPTMPTRSSRYGPFRQSVGVSFLLISPSSSPYRFPTRPPSEGNTLRIFRR